MGFISSYPFSLFCNLISMLIVNESFIDARKFFCIILGYIIKVITIYFLDVIFTASFFRPIVYIAAFITSFFRYALPIKTLHIKKMKRINEKGDYQIALYNFNLQKP